MYLPPHPAVHDSHTHHVHPHHPTLPSTPTHTHRARQRRQWRLTRHPRPPSRPTSWDPPAASNPPSFHRACRQVGSGWFHHQHSGPATRWGWEWFHDWGTGAATRWGEGGAGAGWVSGPGSLGRRSGASETQCPPEEAAAAALPAAEVGGAPAAACAGSRVRSRRSRLGRVEDMPADVHFG